MHNIFFRLHRPSHSPAHRRKPRNVFIPGKNVAPSLSLPLPLATAAVAAAAGEIFVHDFEIRPENFHAGTTVLKCKHFQTNQIKCLCIYTTYKSFRLVSSRIASHRMHCSMYFNKFEMDNLVTLYKDLPAKKKKKRKIEYGFECFMYAQCTHIHIERVEETISSAD